MKKIFTLMILAVLACVSCVDKPIAIVPDPEGSDAPTETVMGGLALSVGSVTDYTTIITTKTDGGEIDYTDTGNYDVIIDGPTKKTMKFSELAGNVIELGSGSYSISVTSPATEPAAFEQPIYRATADFEIRAGEVTPLDLVCTPYNCKVTIELSENFKKELATYEVVINNGLGTLKWVKDETKDDFALNKAGYFFARGLEIKVKGHRSLDNTEASIVHYIKNPQPADHHVIKLDAKVTGVIGGITIDVSTEFTEKEENIEIGGVDESYVDRPDFGSGDDSEEEEGPKNEIIWADNKLFEDYSITKDSEISMTISMPAGIKEFIVDVEHDGFKAALAIMTGDLNGDGVNESYIDLINDNVFANNIAGIDGGESLPVGDRILGQTQVEFDLTCFVGLLCDTAPGESIPFVLKAYDNNDDPLYFMGSFPRIVLVTPAAE